LWLRLHLRKGSCRSVGGNRREAVALINILAELGETLGRGPGCNINPVYRNLGRKLGIHTLAGADDFVDMSAIPAWCILEQPGHIVANVLDADAAGRHKA